MKILVIKLGALGDIIISTAVIKQITEHHHNDNVHLITTPAFENLFLKFESLHIKTFERKGFANAVKTISWIRQQNFDRIYDLQSNDRTSVYCALSGVPFRAGNHPRFPYHAHPDSTYVGECHSFERLNQIIMSANIAPAKALPYLPVPDNVVNEVSEWIKKHSLSDKPFVLMHAGSSPSHINKRWPYFSELASKISHKMTVIWVGSDDDIELNQALSKNTGINATNNFSILGLVELGKRARFAITNDSAPMHILSCSQIPVFGLFGPTYPRRTHALGQFDNVISANAQIAENDNSFVPQDISTISVDTIIDRLNEKGLL